MKNLKTNRKILYLILTFIIIAVFTMSMAYAVLGVTLNISGNAQVNASSWSIILDNPRITSGSVNNNSPVISNNMATFSAILNVPGDYYEFSIDVKNTGTIDAMINGVTKTPVLSANQTKYLNYVIEYQNGDSINSNQLVKAGEFVRLKVRLEFRKDLTSSDLPTSVDNLNCSFTINYVQAADGVSVNNNGINMIDFSIDGEEYAVKEGTTWGEVSISNYYFYNNNSLFCRDGEFYGMRYCLSVSPNDLIIVNKQYYTSRYGTSEPA